MSDLMRMTGMYSGMDTEAVIQSLVSAKSKKVTDLKNEQKKLEWKQNIWQDLNSKIYNLYSKTLSSLRFSSGFIKKTTTVSDNTKATVDAGSGAVDGQQTLEVKKVAKAKYITGNQISSATGEKLGLGDTLADIDSRLSDSTIKVKVGSGDEAKETEIKVSKDMTISDFVDKLNEAGVKASFDTENQRFFISAADSGVKNSFTIGIDGAQSALNSLGISETNYVDGKSFEAEDGSVLTGSDTMGQISSGLDGKKIKVAVGNGLDVKETEIEIKSSMKISEFVTKLREAGVNASFDPVRQKFSLSAEASDKNFTLGGDADALKTLGIDTIKAGAVVVDAQDAEIVLNGAEFTSASNTFSVNGLTITATGVTDGELTINTKTNYDAIYDTIKDFISEYNEIVNEVYARYNPDSSKKYWQYDMLTDEEKESMSDDEIEAWEDNIKESLLRKDNSLYKVMNCLTSGVTKGIEVNGQTKYLFDFGIGTLNYFEAADGERKSLHINGDADDDAVASKTDKLMAALTEDPEGTVEFFAAFCKNMYDSLNETMQSTEYRSIYKVYDDKRLQSEYDDYTKKIKEAEDELSDYEDKWYKKFSDMEVALSKLQAQQNTISSMLGM